jgi:hypothetical protein
MTVTAVFFFRLLPRERLVRELITRKLPPRLPRVERERVLERRERDCDPPDRLLTLRRREELERELLGAVRRLEVELAERERLRLDADRERPVREVVRLREDERDPPLLREDERFPAARDPVRETRAPLRLDTARPDLLDVPRCERLPACATVSRLTSLLKLLF